MLPSAASGGSTWKKSNGFALLRNTPGSARGWPLAFEEEGESPTTRQKVFARNALLV
jgi:hypothetical protein